MKAHTDEGTGMEVYRESGKTVFAAWVDSSDARLIFTYRVPFRAPLDEGAREMTLAFQKQPGTAPYLHFLLAVPEGREIVADAHSGVSTEFAGELRTDTTFTLTVK